jgi:hypothetical protein
MTFLPSDAHHRCCRAVLITLSIVARRALGQGRLNRMPSLRLVLAPHYTLQRLCVFALYLVVVATPAYAQRGGNDYFPLAVGSQWRYRGRFSSDGSKPVPLQGAARVSGKALIQGKEYYKYVITSNFSQVSRAPGPFEDVRYYRVSRGGIFIISGKNSEGSEFLEMPLPLRAGSRWSSGAAEARAESAGTVKIGGRSYYDCLKVSFKAADGARSTEYYLAPGVGVIKGIYKDSTAPESVMEMTLEAYKR